MNSRIINAFLQIFDQEYSLDSYRWSLEKTGSDTKHFYLYRFFNKRFFSFLSRTYSLIYPFIILLIPLYFCCLFIKTIFTKFISANDFISKYRDCDSVVLNYSCHSLKLYKAVFNRAPSLVISPVWQSAITSDQSVRTHTLLSYFDYFIILFKSIYLWSRFIFVLSPCKYIYLSFIPSVLECLAVIDKIPVSSKLFFCNHYDRWACAFAMSRKHEHILIQHGVVSAKVPLAHKIDNVTTAYTLSDSCESIMRDHILTKGRTNYIKYNQNVFIEKVSLKRKQILVINQPNTTARDIKLLNLLAERLSINEFDFMLKVHPLVKTSLKKLSSDIIVCHKINPASIVTVAYDSTLGIEYEKQGYRVLWIKKEDSIKSSVDNIIGELGT